jgi:flavin reductase (DIM6/NTAB) family NADH-FMN oxidoreductase RutF
VVVRRRSRQNPGMELPGEFDVSLRSIAVASAPEGIGESFFDASPTPELYEVAAMDFRRTLGMFATGVTVITTKRGEQVHGMTANAFMSVSLQPPLILISVDRRAKMNAMLYEGAHYGVSVLEERQTAISDRFAGRTTDDGAEPVFELVQETPLVQDALANLVARVVRCYWGGDHSLFLGQVEYARYGDGTPLLFHGGRYERVVQDSHVFETLPEELLRPILAVGVERSYPDGTMIMRRGDPGDTLCLVAEGTVRVERPGRSLELGPGEVIGEIEVLDPTRGRIADITAVGDVRCLEITRSDLRTALEANPRAAFALIEILAARFRETA